MAVTRCNLPDDAEMTVEAFINRLEEAGKTLMALKVGGHSTLLAQRQHEYLYEHRDYGNRNDPPRLRMPAPSGQQISRMDEVHGWILIIPETRASLRRVLHARSLVHPLTDQHMFSWRLLAQTMATDHKKVQRMFIEGCKIIIKGLPKRPTPGYENGSGAEMRH
jgi:hypothetical protein